MDFRLDLNNNRDLQLLFGRYDQNLKIIEKELGVRIVRSEDGIKIIGNDPQVQKASELVPLFDDLCREGQGCQEGGHCLCLAPG